MNNFLTALQFLTVIPIKTETVGGDINLSESMAHFPLVGALIGLALVGVWKIGIIFLPSVVVCALVLAISILLTGALHLDGFADTVDGISGSSDKDQILNIMKSGSVGAMGMVGTVMLLLFKFTLLYSLPSSIMGQSLILMVVMGRWSMVFSCQAYSATGNKESLGRKFIQHIELRQLIGATSVMIILLTLLAGIKALIIFPFIFIVLVLFNHFLVKKIGGLTGDTLGALNELTEVATLFVLAITV